jgi:2-succinyl-5-enolpyruvyl-6-hydroxy-3-cyclohexene-1-carboxylate synthase
VALQQSVPNVSAVQATFVATLVDEWTRAGLRDVVICPGSRSTPLALAMARHVQLRVHVRVDERSAAFFAIGRALASQTPVAIVVTSGTAAAEVHAAVAEADLARVPLLVLTADRPPELHGVGAAQTINQTHLFGSMVRRFEEPGVARLDAVWSWRPLAQRLFRAARGDGGLAGPVHANLAFVEPLLGEPLDLPPALGELTTPVRRDHSEPLAVNAVRVLCVVGAGTSATMIEEAWASNWVVVGDATARGTLAYADPLCRYEAIWEHLRPDLIVRLGGVPASKVLAQRLAAADVPVVGFDAAGPVADPDGVVTQWRPGGPDSSWAVSHGDPDYVHQWRAASDGVDLLLRSGQDGPLDEVMVARRVVEIANRTRVPLVVGSSMPVRDVEWWSPSRTTRVFANRGANGIDGVMSTVMGVASGDRALGLVGDVTFLHDVSALVDGVGPATSATVVVNDNGGGGIFSFLAQGRQLDPSEFDALFATPRHHDLVRVGQAFGHDARRVTSREELDEAVAAGLDESGLHLVVASVLDRVSNVARHDELNDVVAQWWASR